MGATTSLTTPSAMKICIIILLLSTAIMAKPNPQVGDHHVFHDDQTINGGENYGGGRHHYAPGSHSRTNSDNTHGLNMGRNSGSGSPEFEGTFNNGQGGSGVVEDK